MLNNIWFTQPRGAELDPVAIKLDITYLSFFCLPRSLFLIIPLSSFCYFFSLFVLLFHHFPLLCPFSVSSPPLLALFANKFINTTVAPPPALTDEPWVKLVSELEAQMDTQQWRIGSALFEARLDALLAGHENWVYSAAWHPQTTTEENACLVSASMDKTIIVWLPQAQENGIWLEHARMGEVCPLFYLL